MKKYPTHRVICKQSEQGATLIEVLVSVFLLTFGILGLMAAQLRSVAAVSESESRNIAAQAAENLAEAMQTNPRIVVASNGNEKRDYGDYLENENQMKRASVADTCKNTPATIDASSKDPCALGSNAITKKELAEVHLKEFEYILQQMPNAVNIAYTVCIDNPSKILKADLSSGHCSKSEGNPPVIKIVWSTLKDKEQNDDGIPEEDTQFYYLVVPK